MSTVWLYRASCGLLLLFALGHQLGFRHVDPAWGVDSVVRGMQATRFPVQGFHRSYWDFFSGFGFFSTAFLIFSALLAFDLSRQSADVLANLRFVRWAFAVCYVAIALLMVTNFFAAPVVFSSLIAVALVAAASITPASSMNTRTIIEQYFERLKNKSGWESSLADDVVFDSFTSPPREVRGKAAYLETTKRFYGSIKSMKVRQLTVDGDRAVAQTRYELRGPAGDFTSDVAESFGVANGKINSFAIYFDTAPFPK